MASRWIKFKTLKKTISTFRSMISSIILIKKKLSIPRLSIIKAKTQPKTSHKLNKKSKRYEICYVKGYHRSIQWTQERSQALSKTTWGLFQKTYITRKRKTHLRKTHPRSQNQTWRKTKGNQPCPSLSIRTQNQNQVHEPQVQLPSSSPITCSQKGKT